eukprot:5614434-Amphidinium_carterae.1
MCKNCLSVNWEAKTQCRSCGFSLSDAMRVIPGQWPPENATLDILRLYDDQQSTPPPQGELPAQATPAGSGERTAQPAGAQPAAASAVDNAAGGLPAGSQPVDPEMLSSDSDSDAAQELEEYPGRLKSMTPTQLNTKRAAVEAADKAIAHMPGLGDAKRVIAAKLRRLAEEVQHRRPKGEQLSQLDSKHRKAVAAHSKTVANINKLQADLRAAQQLEKEQASEVQATATRLSALKKELASSVLQEHESATRAQAQQEALSAVLAQTGLEASRVAEVTAALQAALRTTEHPPPVDVGVVPMVTSDLGL